MGSPYAHLAPTQFWKTGVAGQDPRTIQGLYRKRFAIPSTLPVATAGSCFAQHIARHLKARGFSVIDAEPAPPGLDAAVAQAFGYGLYSARYGNLYAVRQLLQLAQEAFGTFTPRHAVWESEGRFVDALRPSVEPGGLPSPEHVANHRRAHLAHVRAMLSTAGVFIFTLGLTEAWIETEGGTVFPAAPGTRHGTFDPALHAFWNFTYEEILADFVAFRALVHAVNPGLRFLLTVSPVPLAATASDGHVLMATMHSKSTLRAVAGALTARFADIDYFPSYELIASPVSKGMFYDETMRAVTSAGVEAAMAMFFAEHAAAPPTAAEGSVPEEDLVCEDILLDAFAR